MVGHSFGGYNVRVFTSLYPGDVAGVGLVDAEHGDEEKRVEELLPRLVRDQERQSDQRADMLDRVLAPLLFHLGIDRLKAAAGWDGHKSLPKELRRLRQRSEEAGMAENAADFAVISSNALAFDLESGPSGSRSFNEIEFLDIM